MTAVPGAQLDSAPRIPWSVAVVVLIIAVPGTGTYLFIHRDAVAAAISNTDITSLYSSLSTLTDPHATSISRSPLEIFAPVCRPGDTATPTVIHHLLESACDNIQSGFFAIKKHFGISARHLISAVPYRQFLSVLITTALLGAVAFLNRQYPDSWTARHQFSIANALHFLLAVGFAQQKISTEELALATLVMVSFDMFQRAMDWDAKKTDKSDHSSRASSVAETLMTRSRSAQTANGSQMDTSSESGASESDSSAEESKEAMVRLQGALVDLKTANRVKEGLLRRTREELKNARDTLNETYGDYCSLRDELKNIKQNLAREHQAVVYRKDIELFALRKGNEQKEKYIREHDAKLEEVFQQQKSTVELKDTQLRMLKERLAFLERQSSPRFSQEFEEAMDGDRPLEVRMLRVKNAAKQAEDVAPTEIPSADEEKDATIAEKESTIAEKEATIAKKDASISERNATIAKKDAVIMEQGATISRLEEQLDATRKTADEVVNQEAELSRAWGVVKKVQGSLKDERRLHSQTREQLQELTVRFEEEEQKSRINLVGRLPTIAEDKDELESMFDKTQEENLRLYTEMEGLEKRLRDANSRMFNAEQEVTSLREELQLQLEKSKSQQPEPARPSVQHHVHFQRMEMQLKENRDALTAKTNEIELLKRTIAGKNDYVKDLQAEVDAAVNFHTQDQDEIERLKQSVAELQATKTQLMRDRERLSLQRTHTRLRISSVDQNSARSSGATLIQESSPPLTNPSDERALAEMPPILPMPTESPNNDNTRNISSNDNTRNNSIQETPKRHLRSESAPVQQDLMSNDVPPPELRGMKRRSLGLKDLMKKMVKMDTKSDDVTPRTSISKEEDIPEVQPMRGASSKDKNAHVRPSTAGPNMVTQDQFYTPPSTPTPQSARPSSLRRLTPRYYAEQEAAKKEAKPQAAQTPSRPQTATGNASATKADAGSASKRFSWGTSRPQTATGDVDVNKPDTGSASKRFDWSAKNKLKRRSLY